MIFWAPGRLGRPTCPYIPFSSYVATVPTPTIQTVRDVFALADDTRRSLADTPVPASLASWGTVYLRTAPYLSCGYDSL